jgi:hypothetical protein
VRKMRSSFTHDVVYERACSYPESFTLGDASFSGRGAFLLCVALGQSDVKPP